MRRPLLVLGALLLSACDNPAEPRPIPQELLFSSDRGGNTDIYAMNADGSQLVRLTDHPAFDAQARWSPDGRRIAFTSSRDSVLVQNRWQTKPQVYLMNADGSRQRRLTNMPYGAGTPDWSPDGRRLAFVGPQQGPDSPLGIYVIDADGSNPVLVTGLNGWSDFGPRWSPDGRRIAFLTDRSPDGFSIWLMNPDGSGQVQLPRVNEYDSYEFAWSPDGKQIVFTQDRAGPWGLFTMNVSGNPDFVQLTPDHVQGASPVWSPDGTQIAFAGQGLGGHHAGDAQDVYVMPARGGPARNLPGAGNDFVTSWKRPRE